MSDNKWFKKTASDTDSDSDDDDSTDSTSNSSTDSSSSDDASSNDSSDSSKAAQPNNLKAWLKSGKGSDSDSDDDRKKNKVISKKDKMIEAIEKHNDLMGNHLNNKDFGSCVDDLEALEKLVSKMPANASPRPFISALKKLKDFFADNDEKQIKSKLNKIQAKSYSKIRNKTKKLFVKYEKSLETYVSDSDSDSTTWDPDASDSGSDDEGRKKKDGDDKKKEEKEEWTEETIEKKLELIKADRGKKATKTSDLIAKLNHVLSHTGQWKHLTLYVLGVLLSCQLDNAQHGAAMSQNIWDGAYQTLTRMLNVVQDNPNLIAVEEDTGTKREKNTACDILPDGKVKVYLIFSFQQVVDRLGEEYTKALQYTDPHSQDYIHRLTDEGYLMDAAERVFLYYKSQGKNETAVSMALKMMDHLYYRRDTDHAKMLEKQRTLTFDVALQAQEQKAKEESESGDDEEKNEDAEEGTEEEEGEKTSQEEVAAKIRIAQLEKSLDHRVKKTSKLFVTDNLKEVVKALHKYIHRYCPDREDNVKTKALFYYIYHLALHDNYTKARDLLLMSKRTVEYEERSMKDQEDHTKFVTNSRLMILYNRVLAQLGLSAFRAGDLNDTLVLLNELCATIRTKEHLAQALVKSRDKLESEQKAEKAKLIPMHMHINVELLDGVHLIAAMLYEVPSRAQYPHDTKRRPMSKAFTKLLANFSQQVFLGPPETTKEHIYAAYLALQKGDWSTANQHIMVLPLWNLIGNSDKVKDMITQHVKTVGLRTYLFSFSQYYATVQLGELAEKYGLEESKVHATISKMILRQQITAAWDQPQQCICVEQNSVTKLQFLSTQLADKCVHLVEYNEQRQAEKEARQSGREMGYSGGYMHKRGRGGGRWDHGTRNHRLGLQKSREVEKKKDGNPFVRKNWNR
eukprot:TRINITY_DN6528_c2_g1_i1.p1 TRINITY_DN6528_c2_g1~~TRINITY_DN6528_c2_g1_i1.p1  ORF type:complete len:910 (+),score=294.47 TRINITY_DN6528_c2_g1_i1:37-2766(+)